MKWGGMVETKTEQQYCNEVMDRNSSGVLVLVIMFHIAMPSEIDDVFDKKLC